jgi:hypothetical protein
VLLWPVCGRCDLFVAVVELLPDHLPWHTEANLRRDRRPLHQDSNLVLPEKRSMNAN